MNFRDLKDRQRSIRDTFPSDLGLRVHRALSWMQRAEQEHADADAAFIFYWIAFNAAYADEMQDPEYGSEKSAFQDYFEKVTSLDATQRIYDVLWQRFPQEVRLFLDNRYVYLPFWKHHNGVPGYSNWAESFAATQRRIHRALASRQTLQILVALFDRLYVLRNQIFHGGSTWSSGVNRAQVQDGARIMGLLVPIFIDLLMDHPHAPWGKPYYPVVDDR